MMRLSILLIFSPLFFIKTSAREPVRVIVEVIEAPLGEVASLMSASDAQGEDIYLNANKLVQEGRAQITDLSLVLSEQGHSVELESCLEYIYPTEYAALEMIVCPPPPVQTLFTPAEPLRRRINPVAYETRDVGINLKIAPNSGSPNGSIDISFSYLQTSYPELINWFDYQDYFGSAPIRMPQFSCYRINQSTTLSPGVFDLISIQSPTGVGNSDDAVRRLIFLRADRLSNPNMASGDIKNTKSDPFGEADADWGFEAPAMLRLQIELIESSTQNVASLLASESSTIDQAQLRDDVDKMIHGGKAELLDTVFLTGSNTELMKGDVGVEFIYPIEYEPPVLPRIPLPEELRNVEAFDSTSVATRPHPVAFETRILGLQVSSYCFFDPDSDLIQVILEAEISQLIRNHVWSEWNDSMGDSSIRMPFIYNTEFESKIKVLPGRSMLVSVFTPPDQSGIPDPGRKVMTFIRCDKLMAPTSGKVDKLPKSK